MEFMNDLFTQSFTLHSVFEMEIHTEIECSNCNYYNETLSQPCSNLSVHLPNSKSNLSLQDIVNHYFHWFPEPCIAEKCVTEKRQIKKVIGKF